VAAYQASLPALMDEPDSQSGTWPPDPAWLLPVLRKVLNLKISIADKQAVAEVVKEGLAKGRAWEDVAENLIAALRPDVVEIQLPHDYLRQITTADSESGRDKFAMMRDGLFYELGLHYPKFRFLPVEGLKPDSFAFKVNHLTMLPRVGLQPNECLVNDTPERLKLLNIQGKAAINPANGNDCGIIDSNFQHIAASAGLTTWDQMEYLVLCFAADLRENSACLLHRQAVRDQLAQLQLEQAFPALVRPSRPKSLLSKSREPSEHCSRRIYPFATCG
jgi:type III secretory pathway component EscV